MAECGASVPELSRQAGRGKDRAGGVMETSETGPRLEPSVMPELLGERWAERKVLAEDRPPAKEMFMVQGRDEGESEVWWWGQWADDEYGSYVRIEESGAVNPEAVAEALRLLHEQALMTWDVLADRAVGWAGGEPISWVGKALDAGTDCDAFEEIERLAAEYGYGKGVALGQAVHESYWLARAYRRQEAGERLFGA